MNYFVTSLKLLFQKINGTFFTIIFSIKSSKSRKVPIYLLVPSSIKIPFQILPPLTNKMMEKVPSFFSPFYSDPGALVSLMRMSPAISLKYGSINYVVPWESCLYQILWTLITPRQRSQTAWQYLVQWVKIFSKVALKVA